MKFLRGLVFFPMLWLRRLVLGIMRILSGLFALAGFVVLVVSAVTRYHLWLLGAALLLLSFLSFMAMYLYDSILISLNPTARTFFFY
jgi:hypothetical protein